MSRINYRRLQRKKWKINKPTKRRKVATPPYHRQQEREMTSEAVKEYYQEVL